jgi:7-cyano-7-deazaguanine tRNA-ribosyltransferase
LLAEHNLFVSFAELRLVKQAILEGRLWEHLETRAHAHPALLQALKRLRNYEDYFEKNSPVTKNSGLFFYSSVGLARPEVVHYKKKVAERYLPPEEAEILFLLPQTSMKPFHKAREWRGILSKVRRGLREKSSLVHVCTYAAPFGVVPEELDEVYPLSQHEVAVPLDHETVEYVARQLAAYIERTNYKSVVLLEDRGLWGNNITNACRRVCRKKNIDFVNIQREGRSDKIVAQHILEAFKP